MEISYDDIILDGDKIYLKPSVFEDKNGLLEGNSLKRYLDPIDFDDKKFWPPEDQAANKVESLEKRREYYRKYYTDNLEKYKQRARVQASRSKRKRYECECGRMVAFYNKKHIDTTLHLKALQKKRAHKAIESLAKKLESS